MWLNSSTEILRLYRGVPQLVMAMFLAGLSFFPNIAESNETQVPVETKIIKVGYIEFPPVFSTNAKNEAEGILIDITKKVLDELGYHYSFVSMPAKRMAASLVSGKIDLWVGLPSLPDFGDGTLAGESVVSTIHLRAYRVKKIKDVFKVSDLKGLTVILISGYGYGGMTVEIMKPDSGIKYFIAQDHSAGLAMLTGNRGDLLLDYKEPIDTLLKDKKVLKKLKFNEVSEIAAKFVVSKKNPDHVKFLEALEGAFKKLKSLKKL